MNDELTALDIQKMRDELNERINVLRPQIIEAVKRTRAFGDLSENFEYKEAKRAKSRNESRIRYLERMINSAHIIEDKSAADEVGLYDKVELFMPEDGSCETVQVVTTIRCDPLSGLISRESPLGKALLGRKAGDTVMVHISESYSYEAQIRSIEKGEDDGSAPILSY